MPFFIITFRSVTYAQRGENLLKSARFRCNLSRTPRWTEEQGCGYALRVYCEDISRAAELLRREGIPLRRIYFQRQDGSVEVVEA